MSKADIESLFSKPLERPSTDDRHRVTPYSIHASSLSGTRTHQLESGRSFPDVSFAAPFFVDAKVSERQTFTLFNDRHKEIAARLFQILANAPDRGTFVRYAKFLQARLDPELFQYALAVALQHRQDMNDVEVKLVSELFPASFVEPSAILEGRRLSHSISDEEIPVVRIPHNYTASKDAEEQRVAYFREDIGVNSHHWHWHLAYPAWGVNVELFVNKDRRGELFYYMHRQIVARFNVERICNGLEEVKPLLDLREPLEEGYFPKILSSITNRTYPARLERVVLQNIIRSGIQVNIPYVERCMANINTAIENGFAVNERGISVPLRGDDGIDVLGNMIESSQLSPNRTLYGDIHNAGHLLIALCHDPRNKYLEDISVMGDVKTAMRDPLFYRWHRTIDVIFEKQKRKLMPYLFNEIVFSGVTVDSVDVRRFDKRIGLVENALQTFWDESAINIGAAIDFNKRDKVMMEFTHLQHEPFDYRITVTNSRSLPIQGTCRIFICPRKNVAGIDLSFEAKRMLMIELDKFKVNLRPGSNTVIRKSIDSNVTIPHERTFREVGNYIDVRGPLHVDGNNTPFCGCGWPHHLLIPMGTAEGMEFDLFAMITDHTLDFVGDTGRQRECNDSTSYCGLQDQKYPDKRPMGYPFDRPYHYTTIEQFANSFPNMNTRTIKIFGKPHPE